MKKNFISIFGIVVFCSTHSYGSDADSLSDEPASQMQRCETFNATGRSYAQKRRRDYVDSDAEEPVNRRRIEEKSVLERKVDVFANGLLLEQTVERNTLMSRLLYIFQRSMADIDTINKEAMNDCMQFDFLALQSQSQQEAVCLWAYVPENKDPSLNSNLIIQAIFNECYYGPPNSFDTQILSERMQAFTLTCLVLMDNREHLYENLKWLSFLFSFKSSLLLWRCKVLNLLSYLYDPTIADQLNCFLVEFAAHTVTTKQRYWQEVGDLPVACADILYLAATGRGALYKNPLLIVSGMRWTGGDSENKALPVLALSKLLCFTNAFMAEKHQAPFLDCLMTRLLYIARNPACIRVEHPQDGCQLFGAFSDETVYKKIVQTIHLNLLSCAAFKYLFHKGREDSLESCK